MVMVMFYTPCAYLDRSRSFRRWRFSLRWRFFFHLARILTRCYGSHLSKGQDAPNSSCSAALDRQQLERPTLFSPFLSSDTLKDDGRGREWMITQGRSRVLTTTPHARQAQARGSCTTFACVATMFPPSRRRSRDQQGYDALYDGHC